MIVCLPSIGGKEVAEHYDRLNGLYIDVWGSHRHHGFWKKGSESVDQAIASMTERVVQAAKPGVGGRVIDVGCGTGGVAWYFADQIKAEVLGYTLSMEEKLTAEGGGEQVKKGSADFICGDWLDNVLPDECADAVVLIESFSHMEDRQAVLAEVARVLKPGGRLVLTDWVAAQSPQAWQVKYLLEPMCRGGRLTGLSSLEENRDLLEAVSLQVMEASDITVEVKKTWRVIAGRLICKVLSDATYRKFMWQSLRHDRAVFFAIPRVMIAYRLGCLSYGWLVAQKGSCARGRTEAEVPQ